MRILVVSDTHGDNEALETLLSMLGHRMDMLLHLGDGASELRCPSLSKVRSLVAVRGNGDYEAGLPLELVLNMGSSRALCIHGHKSRAGEAAGDLLMARAAREAGASLVLHGHTHIPRLERRHSITFCCPGSLSRPRTSLGPTFAVIHHGDADDTSRPSIVIYAFSGREIFACNG